MLTPSSSKTLRPKGGLEKLLSKAFAPPETPTITPSTSLSPLAVKRPMAPEPPETPLHLDTPQTSQGHETIQTVPLSPVWNEVRQAKERALAGSPSKVKSLETGSPETAKTSRGLMVKRKSSISFKESADGRYVTATFDMPGVKKQDMHVSFRTSRVMISWRTIRITETREGDSVVREREEKVFTHVIPLPIGTKFDEIKASRDGRHLTLTFPNYRCIRVGSHTPKTKTTLSGETEFRTCAESR